MLRRDLIHSVAFLVMLLVVTTSTASDDMKKDRDATAEKAVHISNYTSASYPELGILINGVTLGHWWEKLGMRMSVMYQDEKSHSMMLNLGFKFSDNRTTQHSLNIYAGRYAGPQGNHDEDVAFIGAGYAVNWHGIFLELGPAREWYKAGHYWGSKSPKESATTLGGSFGYVYRFLPGRGK